MQKPISDFHYYILLLLYKLKQKNKYCVPAAGMQGIPPENKNAPCIIKITADRGRQRFKKKTYISVYYIKSRNTR